MNVNLGFIAPFVLTIEGSNSNLQVERGEKLQRKENSSSCYAEV